MNPPQDTIDRRSLLVPLHHPRDRTGPPIPGKAALAFANDGDAVSLAAPADAAARILYFSAPRLDEPVAWGGPIAMNTEAELDQAFRELRAGTFVRENPEWQASV